MRLKHIFLILVVLLTSFYSSTVAQNIYTRADTLRGSITPERDWWDLERYDIEIEPNISEKSIYGKVDLTYKVRYQNKTTKLQIDLKEPLSIDSVVLEERKLKFTRTNQSYLIDVPNQLRNSKHTLRIFYSGNVTTAINPPWEGGWVFTEDKMGRPWVTVTSHGKSGTSSWFPSKDHQGDEPDRGMTIRIIVPSDLTGVSNGRLIATESLTNNRTAYKWEVKNTINAYSIIPYIGKYVEINDSYTGEKGLLDLNYWVLDYNYDLAKVYFPKETKSTLAAFEYWFGPYPFYEDSYKLVDVPYAGMEHQSAIAYGNNYASGYSGRSTAQKNNQKWDFIIVHESAHEWFGNSITTHDLADLWVHEGFATYGETLYVDYLFGTESAHEYIVESRQYIQNDRSIIPQYNVNAQGSSDLYTKAANMLHSIRNSINNDEKFRKILRGINSKYFHKNVSGAEIENYISTMSGFDFRYVFKQYLTQTDIPTFEFKIDKENGEVKYRYSGAIPEFNLPIYLSSKDAQLRLSPSNTWKKLRVKGPEILLFSKHAIEKKFLIKAVEL